MKTPMNLIYNTTTKQYFINLFLLFVTLPSFGQNNIDSLFKETPLNPTSQTIPPSTAQKISLPSLFNNHPNYIYNNSKDTIQLSSIDSSFGICQCTVPQIITEIQIDKKGAKELVFYRKCTIRHEFYQSSYRQMINTTIKKYEIWNLDNKQLLFEAQTYYKSHFDGINFSSAKPPKRKKSSTHYQYNFAINKKGNIKIKQLRGKSQALAKTKQGTYCFKNGKYHLES